MFLRVCAFLVVISFAFFAKAAESDPFETWKNTFQKSYASLEEEQRARSIWQGRFEDMEVLHKQAQEGGYRVELNHLADKDIREILRKPFFHDSPVNEDNSFQLSNKLVGDLPDSVDWRKKGVVSSVKNQGEVGASVLYAFVDVLESHHAIKTGKLEYASMVELQACCSQLALYTCVKQLGGICLNSTYKPEEGKCENASCKPVFTFNNMVTVPRGNEEMLAKAVTVEPVLVAVDAGDSAFLEYKDGVFNDPKCTGAMLDHAMLLVGYGQTEQGKKYWILKNSWGADWGMQGYMMLARDAGNMCGVATMATYPE